MTTRLLSLALAPRTLPSTLKSVTIAGNTSGATSTSTWGKQRLGARGPALCVQQRIAAVLAPCPSILKPMPAATAENKVGIVDADF